ncbi:MAG: hypothetical protein MUF83_12480 [Acidimicrobiales bacterium]|jgi:hypothetical protein|nr:hypothetical protein [Acidimicrobiales bacterium]
MTGDVVFLFGGGVAAAACALVFRSFPLHYRLALAALAVGFVVLGVGLLVG